MKRNSFIASVQKITRFVRNWSFARETKVARGKTYLYNTPQTKRSQNWFEIYQKAKRWAYLRPLYSSFWKSKEKLTILGGFIGAFLIVGSIYIFFYSSYFEVSPNRLIIERTDEYSDINIAYRAIEPLYGQSIWGVDKKEVTSLISALQKNVTNIELERVYPNTLRIIMESSPLLYAVKFPWVGRAYELSENGTLIPNRSGISRLPKLTLYSPELQESPFLDFRSVADTPTMARIQSITAILKSDFGIEAVKELIYYAVENELHVSLKNGNRLLFVLDSTLNTQLLGVKFTGENTPGLLTGSWVIYIDARSIGKIFICRDPVACPQNILKIYGNPLF
jgi:hypothetical protein